MGAPRALALCYNFGGALDFQAGRWQEAESNLRDAVKLYRDVGSAAGEALSLQRLGVLLTARGALEEARGLLAEGLVVAERAAMRSHCLTRLHASMIRNRLADNDHEGIQSSLADGLAAAARHGNCVTCNALLLPELVRVHIALDDLDAADACCERLQRIAAEFGSQVWNAMSAQCAGRVMLARGRLDEADHELQRAVDAYLAASQPYEAARCLKLQARCRTADEAARVAARAHALFAGLGAPDIE